MEAKRQLNDATLMLETLEGAGLQSKALSGQVQALLDECRKMKDDNKVQQASAVMDVSYAAGVEADETLSESKREAETASQQVERSQHDLAIAQKLLTQHEVVHRVLELGAQGLDGLGDAFPGLNDWLEEKTKA